MKGNCCIKWLFIIELFVTWLNDVEGDDKYNDEWSSAEEYLLPEKRMVGVLTTYLPSWEWNYN